MSVPSDLPRDVPFSISCYECDCGSPESLDQAIAEGWTDIEFTRQGLAENFLGYCPEHRVNWDEELGSSAPV